MQTEVRVDEKRKRLVFKSRGSVRFEDFISVSEEAYRAGDYQAFDQLIDFTEAIGLEFSASEIRKIALLDKDYCPGVKIAVVASTLVLQGVDKIYALYTEVLGGNNELRNFTNMQDAFRWLESDQRQVSV